MSYCAGSADKEWLRSLLQDAASLAMRRVKEARMSEGKMGQFYQYHQFKSEDFRLILGFFEEYRALQ